MHIKVKSIIITLLFLFTVYTPAYATVYLNLNAEEGTVGATVPYPPFEAVNTSVARATYQSSGGTPQGSKYYQWQTVNSQLDHLTAMWLNNSTPITNIIGNTYYLAYFFRFDRINGLDIWHELNDQSYDKLTDIMGSGVRWTFKVGQHEAGCYTQNQDHRFTVGIGNSGYNFSGLECVDQLIQNSNGYSASNPIQLTYEAWHSVVIAIKMSFDNTGSVTIYINGIKVLEYNNIRTVADSSSTLRYIYMGGTIAQTAYDAPAHYRKFDAFMLTDNWQDIIDGGYLSGEGGDTQAPTVPDGLLAQAISSSQINLSWAASTDNVGVTEYRIYRNNTQIATTTSNTSYSDTGLSSSTTYTYNVSAYDAAGNNSAQSSSTSATTQAGGGSGGNNSNGDTSASGGSGCGFVKDINGKGQKAKGEGLSLMIMLVITLTGIALAKRTGNITATKEGVLVMNMKKISLIKIAAISFLLTIFWSASAYAQPNITSFSGSLTQKGTLTITGSGFGTKAQAAPLKWDDFESGTAGNDLSGWYIASNGINPKYANDKVRPNSALSSKQVFTANDQYNCTIGLTGLSNSKYYLTFYRYMTTSGGPSRNFKMFSLRSGNAGDWQVPEFTHALLPSGNAGIFYNYDLLTNWVDNDLRTNSWNRFEYYIEDLGAVGSYYYWVDGALKNSKTNTPFYSSGSPAHWPNLYIDSYYATDTNNAGADIWHDDIYIDITQARVEIGNAPTWTASTHREIQIPSAWSDTSITITLNKGSFSNFNNAYLYVIDANGNVNTNGYLLSDGGGSGGGNTPPPSSGSGGDSTSSGGSGCGFVKDDGKGQKAKGEGLSLIIMLIIALIGIALAKRRAKNITATREAVLVVNTRKISLIKIATISFLLTIFWSASAYAQPNITSFSGSLTDGSTITINGNSFGVNGPNIVVFDNFESGTNGNDINSGAGSATIGKWDRIGQVACKPKYDNAFSVSGSKSFKADYTIKTNTGTDAGCSAFIDNLNTAYAFLSYWVYLPTTSAFPCYNGGICNWKPAWLYGTNTQDDDQVIPAGFGGTTESLAEWAIFGNDTYPYPWPWNYFTFSMNKGNWYRIWAYIHATNDATGTKELWLMSTNASIPVTKKLDYSNMQIFNDIDSQFETFSFSAWARWCNNCTESAPRFDDVYLATGPTARARVEIGNTPTYNASTNLTIATVTSWSDASITATIRQGSFSNLNNAYLYVVDADGNVNENGYLLSDGGGGNTPPPSSGSGGDSGGGSGGGGGCGFVKDDDSGRGSKGQSIRVADIGLMIMLIITLCLPPIARRLFKAFNRPVL